MYLYDVHKKVMLKNKCQMKIPVSFDAPIFMVRNKGRLTVCKHDKNDFC